MTTPARLLLLRPDTYGDLVLFEPVLRQLRAAWPETEIGVVIREGYADLAPLLPAGVRWLTTRCNPYREGARDCRESLAKLRAAVVAFAPDCLVAACYEQSWLEPAVASFVPKARRIRVAGPPLDAVSQAALDLELGPVSFTEEVEVDPGSLDWEKNLRLVGYLLGRDPERAYPSVEAPETARRAAAAILADRGLTTDGFVACAAAGTANVSIKAWPAERYAETLCWLERERGLRALLVGHENERARLEGVRDGCGAELWLGQDGEIATLAGLLAASRLYFGNDTGAVHLAAALGRPVVSVFGGGHWPRFKPSAHRSATVVQPLPCFGCAWDCLFGYAPCVSEIPAQIVCEALSWLLEGKDEPGEREFHSAALPPAAHHLIAGAVSRRAAALPAAGGGSPAQLTSLLQRLDASENDRLGRLAVIEGQGAEISRLQAEADRWIKEAGELWPRLNNVTNERNLLAAQLADLRVQFQGAEADRAERQRVIERQGAELTTAQAAADHWLRQAGELQERAAHWEKAHAALGFEADDLRKHLAASEADRANRGAAIEAQGARMVHLEGEVHRWLGRARDLQDQTAALEATHAQLTAQIGDWRNHFAASEADRAARLEVIEHQGAEMAAMQAQAHEWRTALTALQQAELAWTQERDRLADVLAESQRRAAAAEAWQARIGEHWTSRVLRKLSLWPG